MTTPTNCAVHPEVASPVFCYVCLKAENTRLREALREGAQRMADILCEYGERGEMERPFIIACSEWQERALAEGKGEMK